MIKTVESIFIYFLKKFPYAINNKKRVKKMKKKIVGLIRTMKEMLSVFYREQECYCEGFVR